MPTPPTAPYKIAQRETRLERRFSKRVLSAGGTINFGIKKFKREHKGDNYSISIFKRNAWGSITPKEPFNELKQSTK